MVQLVGDQGPTFVFSTDTVFNWDPHLIKEHCVDVMLTNEIEFLQGDARGIHRHDENADAFVLGGIGISAYGQPAIVGVA